MKLDSWKKSIKIGVLAGAISFIVYALLVLGAGFLTGWQNFFVVDLPVQKIGKLSWELCAGVGVILASLVPVFTLRYEKVKYLFSYLIVSILALVWLYGMMLLVWMTVYPLWCPFVSLDAVYYLFFSIPIGSVVGTVVAIVLHVMNKD